MKVKATRLGYYGLRRQRAGMVFVLEDPKHFNPKWMESLEKPKVKSKKAIEEEPVEQEESLDVI